MIPNPDYRIAEGWWNAFRWRLRSRVRFSTYQRWIAPLIGWPEVIACEGQREHRYEAVWGDEAA